MRDLHDYISKYLRKTLQKKKSSLLYTEKDSDDLLSSLFIPTLRVKIQVPKRERQIGRFWEGQYFLILLVITPIPYDNKKLTVIYFVNEEDTTLLNKVSNCLGFNSATEISWVKVQATNREHRIGYFWEGRS